MILDTLKIDKNKQRSFELNNIYKVYIKNGIDNTDLTKYDIAFIKVLDDKFCKKYFVIRNNTKLETKDIMILIDNGESRYGYYFLGNNIVIPKINICDRKEKVYIRIKVKEDDQ